MLAILQLRRSGRLRCESSYAPSVLLLSLLFLLFLLLLLQLLLVQGCTFNFYEERRTFSEKYFFSCSSVQSTDGSATHNIHKLCLSQEDQECESGTLDCVDCYSPECCSSGMCAEGTPANPTTSFAGSVDECQEECAFSYDCRFYTFDQETGECSLTQTCRVLQEDGFKYGNLYCSGKEV